MKKDYLFKFLFVKLLIFSIYISFPVRILAQNDSPDSVFILDVNHEWVDSIIKTLSLDEQIAQLIFVDAYSNRSISHESHIIDLIRKYKIGGLVFFQGDPETQASLTNFYQSQSQVPLMIAIDADWGLGMRLEKTIKFPFPMALGAISDNKLIYETGKEIGRELKRLGVHLSLAPVLDINNNPENPVINYRSFGMDKFRVAEKGIMFMKGIQSNHVIACAKHFPGHGDTNIDSHFALPVLLHDQARLDSLELYPFKKVIEEGIGAIMVAHLSIPAIEPAKNIAASLSVPVVSGLLKNNMGFQGLVITDALNMKGVSDYFPPGVVDAKALVAGNDILAFSEDVPMAIEEIKKAIIQGQISREEIEYRCRKVLASKLWTGAYKQKDIKIESLIRDLNTQDARVLKRKLVKESITLLRNKNEIVPVQKLQEHKIASLAIGSRKSIYFQNVLGRYTKIDHFSWNPENENISLILKKLKEYDLVIAGITSLDQRPYKNFGVSPKLETGIQELIASVETIISVFGNPFALNKLPGIENAEGLIMAYQDNALVHEMAAQLIFGAFGANGTLAVSVNSYFKLGEGLQTNAISRLGFALPEEAGLDSKKLHEKIDSIALAGIKAGAYPGCQVLIAKNGSVVFHETYGYHTYENRNKVCKNDIYDFASVTKITGPLPALMRLVDEGKINLDENLSFYWPGLRHSNKADLKIREILAHQSGMKAWIPYWRNTVKKNGKFKTRSFKTDSSAKYNEPVITDMYLHKNYRKKIYSAIKKSPVSEEKKLLYSGLGSYLYPSIIENLTGQDYETFLKSEIYQPLGAYSLTYNAHLHFPLEQIVPTENDTFFRMKQIHGYVHDEGAAMMGGVSGNAGLFGNAMDLAKLMQMYLNMGYYGGKQYISQNTLKEFSSYQYPDNENRRGLGFDKPLIGNQELPESEAYPARSASPSSFGHSGYTGTFTWVDPEENILYIFFSNRVYPTRENSKLYDLNIRTSIQQVIYSSKIQ